MFISMCVIGSQKGDNPNNFISELLPLFCQKIKFSNNFFSTRRIGLKLLTNVTFFFIRRLSVYFFFYPASVCLSVLFSSRFQITFVLLKGLDWNFWQMFLSMCVIGSQKGDNPNNFISELLPLFCQKFKFSNNFFSTQRIGLKLLTNVYINVYDGFTKGG